MKERKFTFSLSLFRICFDEVFFCLLVTREMNSLVHYVPELFLFLITGTYLNSRPPSTVCAGPDNSSLVTVNKPVI